MGSQGVFSKSERILYRLCLLTRYVDNRTYFGCTAGRVANRIAGERAINGACGPFSGIFKMKARSQFNSFASKKSNRLNTEGVILLRCVFRIVAFLL